MNNGQSARPGLLGVDARDPGPPIARLREEDPVHWLAELEAWVATRHADVQALFCDPRLSPDSRHYEGYRPPSPAGRDHWATGTPFLTMDAETGAQERGLVSSGLVPRSVAPMEESVREVVEEFAAPLRGQSGVVEMAGAFAEPIPGAVIGRILGVPRAGRDEEGFRTLARRVVNGINPAGSDKKRLKTERATIRMGEYLLGLVRERRREPRRDLISDLLQASPESQSLADEVVARALLGLIAAGTDSVALAATRAIRNLLLHPDQLRSLREEPGLIPGAVLELLRYDVGFFGMPRYVLEDFELRGKPLCKGQLVVLCFTGAHRDPRVFDEPERLDLRRRVRERDLLAFGHGSHFCVGSRLARLELGVMLEALVELLPEDALLLEERIRWGSLGILSRIKELPVDFRGARHAAACA